jgi:hypothetical protein
MTEDCQEFSTVPFANVRWRHLLTRECSLLIAASLTQAWVQEIEVSAGTVTCKKKHQLCADSAYPTQCKIDLTLPIGRVWLLAACAGSTGSARTQTIVWSSSITHQYRENTQR